MEITKYVCYNKQSGEYLRKHYYNIYNCQKRKNEKKEGGYVEVKFQLATLFDYKDDADEVAKLYSSNIRKYEIKPVRVII